MKLAEIVDLNSRIKLATAKLKTQVQKASVAAAKEPRLNLGTIGVSIGQAQSSGNTSVLESLEQKIALEHLGLYEAFSELQEELTLHENAFVGLAHMYGVLKSTFSTILAKSGNKNSLNDSVLGPMYRDELSGLKEEISALPQKTQTMLSPILNRVGIKIDSVDISRENYIKRIMAVKFFRSLIFILKNALQNPIPTIANLVIPGIGVVLDAILNAKDLKEIGGALLKSVSQVKSLIAKANAPEPRNA